MSKFQIAVLAPMLLLTFTVVIYDYRLFNMKVLGIEVWAHGQYEEEYLESWETVVNITNHPLKEKITYYMNKSIQGEKEQYVGTRGQRIYIFDPEMEAFFGTYYVSTWCLTCQMEMSPSFIDGNAYYYVLIYYSQLEPSLLETCLAYAVSIATAILWLFYWGYAFKLKPELTTLEARHHSALSEGQKENEMQQRRKVKAMIKKRGVERLVIAPLLIVLAGLLGWVSKITSIWQLMIATVILAVLGVYVIAYVAVHPSGEQH